MNETFADGKLKRASTCRSRYALRSRFLVPFVTAFLPFVAVLAAPWVLVRFGMRLYEFVAMLSAYALIMLGTTLGYHRAIAHKSLVLAPIVRYPLYCLGAMAAQGPPGFWVAHHRAHHSDPDGERDPHSPLNHNRHPSFKGFLHSHVIWMFGDGGRYDGRHVRELRGDEAIKIVEKHYLALVLVGLTLPACAFLPFDFSVVGLLRSLYWAGLFRLGVSHQATWLVNSACHLWGYRSYETTDNSRNNWVVALLTMGEGWHNNHHASPARVRHGLKRWEIDPAFAVARVLEATGLADNLRH